MLRHPKVLSRLRLSLFFASLLGVTIMTVALALFHIIVMSYLHPNRIRVKTTPELFGFVDWELVKLETADAIPIEGWFFPPGAAQDGATVLLLHGLGGNRVHMMGPARFLHQAGYGVLAIDLRNHGNSGGELSTFGHDEVNDVKAALAFLQQQPAINPDKIAVYGHSLGGATAILAASELHELKAVIVMSTFADIEFNAAQIAEALTGSSSDLMPDAMVWWGERQAGVPFAALDPQSAVAGIAPRPILIIHGEADGFIVPENADRLYKAAQAPKELLLIPNAGHNDVTLVGGDVLETAVLQFLATHFSAPHPTD